MYTTVAARIYNAARVVSGIRASSQFEPLTVREAPHLYTMLVSVQRLRLGGAVKLTYRTRIRILIPYDETATPETALWGFVNTIPAAVEAAKLDYVADATAGTYTIDQRLCRALDLLVDTIETAPVGTA